MRLTILFIAFSILSTSASVYSQSTKLTLKMKNSRIADVFDEIEQQSEFYFFYNRDNFDDNRLVSVNVEGKTIEQILDELFEGQAVTYEIVNRNVLIKTQSNFPGIAETQQQQQQQMITGKVTDSSGLPLPGVTVVVKGTTKGTVTNGDGNYSISDIPENATLVFSFVGMRTQEVNVGNQTVINIEMETDAIGIEEVVAIGYTVKKRGEITGSVNTINNDELLKTSYSDVTKSLEGKVSGLIINDRGNYPGKTDGTSLLIRGKSTLGNNSPLIVIDGVPTESFSHLASHDIESISVLKDASAAIYGARAANGVILITTKRGKEGLSTINVTAHYKLSTFTRIPKMMSSYQYATYVNEVSERYGRNLEYTEEDIRNYKLGLDPINYPNTDWYNSVMKDWSPEQRYNINSTGGTDKAKYFVSGDILNQNGLYKSNDLKYLQYQVRSNLDLQVTEFLKVGIDVYGRLGKREEPGADQDFINKQTNIAFPTEVDIYPNGLLGMGAENGTNPIILSSNRSGFNNTDNKVFHSLFSFDLNLDKITKGLKIKGYGSFDFNITDQKRFNNTWTYYNYNKATDEYDEYNGYNFWAEGNFLDLSQSYASSEEQLYNVQLIYNRVFGNHNFNAFIAYEQLEGKSKSFSAYKRNLLSSAIPELFTGAEESQRNNGSSNEWGRINYFGSVSYNYDRKYLVDFTLRRDGSQNFPAGKRFGTFPSVSVGWIISEENFMEEFENWLSFFKLRASWAKMGNDRVDNYQYLATYRYGGFQNARANFYFLGLSPTRFDTFTKNNIPNPDITWEYSKYTNIGFDANMWDGLLQLNFNYFYEKRRDILIQRQASIPDYTALKLPDENLGKVDNQGFEMELNHENSIGSVEYNIGGTFSFTDNKVVFLDEAQDVPEYRKREGHPMDSYVVYKTDGIFKTLDEIENTDAKLEGTKPGDIKYVDINKDGNISAEDQIRSYSSPVPKIQFGLITGVKYHRFSASVFFQGQAKDVEIPILFPNEGNKPEFLFTDRWTEENINSIFPRAYDKNDFYNMKTSDFWLRDASFLRLKEVEISYDLPTQWTKFEKIQVFMRGSNLWTLDHIKFFDPEVTSYEPTSGGYGPQTSLMVGVNIVL